MLCLVVSVMRGVEGAAGVSKVVENMIYFMVFYSLNRKLFDGFHDFMSWKDERFLHVGSLQRMYGEASLGGLSPAALTAVTLN